jgi:hypothetical protein
MVDMDDIDPDKALAALEQLEAERGRRLQDKIDSGEVVVQTITVVCTRDEDVEEATARALARHPALDDGREVHREFYYVFTGVPRDPDHWKEENTPQAAETDASSTKGPLSAPDEVEPAGVRVNLSPPSQPAYIFVTTRPATADDPGQISEARWYVDEDGCVVITTLEGRHITGRALLKDEDPAAVARSLLRESEGPKDFNRPISYPKLGLA